MILFIQQLLQALTGVYRTRESATLLVGGACSAVLMTGGIESAVLTSGGASSAVMLTGGEDAATLASGGASSAILRA